jgi:excinuclease UvrABC ATPase subunit
MARADRIIDLGPGAGHDGGRVVFHRHTGMVATGDSPTTKHLWTYLTAGPVRANRRTASERRLVERRDVHHARVTELEEQPVRTR